MSITSVIVGAFDPVTSKRSWPAQKAFPEAVINSGHDLKDHDTHEVIVEDVKSLDNHIINVYLVAAGKELKAELDAAKQRISELES